MLRKINIDNSGFQIDLEGDFYGQEFWTTFENNRYEPDTLDYIRRHLRENDIFIDIGAANGSLVLYAATKGARVLAFEPLPKMFKVLQRNVELNSLLSNQIQLYNSAISHRSGQANFASSSENKILTPIVFTNVDKDQEAELFSYMSLSKVLDSLQRTSESNIYIKMDIEGAEYEILKNSEVLNSLSKYKVKMLLAIHPGFIRTTSAGKFASVPLLKWIPRIWNFIENVSFFKKIQQRARILRTNNEPITNPFKFALMASAGVYEYQINYF